MRDKTIMTPEEQAESMAILRRLITSSWRTNTVRRIKPTPEDEARSALVVIESAIWSTLPTFMRTVDAALEQIDQKPLPPKTALISFGSWIGGDRDGNPFVTSETTKQVLILCRWRAAELIYNEVDQVLFKLSMTNASPELMKAVEPLLGQDFKKWTRATNMMFWRGNIPLDEPYRVLLAPVRDRCKVTAEYLESIIGVVNPPPPPEGYLQSASELMDILLLCYRSLIECGDDDIANGQLLDLIRRIEAFGLSLVSLDIRQESSRHADCIDAITKWLGLGSYLEWSEDEKVKFLVEGLCP